MRVHQRTKIAAFGIGVAWSCAACSQALSDEEDLALVFGDKSTVSLATGSAQALRRAPSVATVITAEDIAALGATDLDEAMETVPGVHVSVTNRYFSTYQMRGIAGPQINPQVLLLQNGVPMNTLYRGDKGQAWGSLPLENVARIEVIRGPGSALYGADAFAGVINIVTKTAADTPGTALGLRAGAHDSRDAWLQHGGKWGPLQVAAYLHVGRTAGMTETIAKDAQSGRDAATGTHASLAPGPLSLGYDAVDASLDGGYDKWHLRGGYKLRDNMGLGAGISSALDPVGKERGERINADLSWADPQYSRDWGLGFTASILDYAETGRYQLSPPGTKIAGNTFVDGMIGQPDRYERQVRLSAFAAYSGLAGHSLRFGLGHDDLDMYETHTNKNYFLTAAGVALPTGPVIDYQGIQPHLLPQRRKLSYLYGQDEWNFAKDWTLTGGLRHDSYSDFGGTTNPRVALVWDAALDLTAKLLWGQAYRAPSFTEQYGINPVANGNPDLKPETIRTLEWACAWQARKDTQVNLSLFRYRMRDVIRAVDNAATGTGATFQNTGGQHGSGLELEAVWDATRRLRLSGHYAYQTSIDEATGQDAGYAPHRHAYARADWHLRAGLLVSGQLNYVAGRRRPAGDARPPIADYTTADLTLRSDRGPRLWNFAVSARNLFNADVREPSQAPGTALPNDLPMAPRTLYLQATHLL
jgi:iron complex outermembrane receptor protein